MKFKTYTQKEALEKIKVVVDHRWDYQTEDDGFEGAIKEIGAIIEKTKGVSR